jgi:branched-chain amino acid aminotransferase
LSPVVFLHDRFVRPEEAMISAFDPGFLLGDGVFATMRGVGGRCFRPRAHLEILARGAKALGLALPATMETLVGLAHECAARTRVDDAYVRLTVTRGNVRPTLLVHAREMDSPSEETYREGVAVATVAARRAPPLCLDGTTKTTSYAPHLIARRQAEARGASFGLELAVDGTVASATMANVFAVIGDRILTPTAESGCRLGITRAAVLELAGDLGLTAEEARIDPEALFSADEVFLTSTRLECLRVATLDGRRVGKRGASSRADELRTALRELIRRETRSAET